MPDEHRLDRRWFLLVQPLRGMDFESLDRSSVGPYSGELDLLAKIIPAFHAQEALLAGLLGLDAHSVS